MSTEIGSISLGPTSLVQDSGQGSVYLQSATEYNPSPPISYSKTIPDTGPNVALVTLWVIVILIAIGIIIFVLWYSLTIWNMTAEKNVINLDSYCTSLTSDLTDYSTLDLCPNMGLVKYNTTLVGLMSPAVIPYQQVCMTYCSTGLYDRTTDTCTSSDQNQVQRTANCVTATKPVDCIGSAKPVGISNGTLYYLNQAQLTSCYT
jgi:hypothetical protein